MSVEDWARWAKRRADEYGSTGHPKSAVASVPYKVGRVDGVADAFDALLSDEAVKAAARSLHDGYAPLSGSFQPNKGWEKQARAALQAAVRAVTDPKTHDSSTTTTGEHTNG